LPGHLNAVADVAGAADALCRGLAGRELLDHLRVAGEAAGRQHHALARPQRAAIRQHDVDDPAAVGVAHQATGGGIGHDADGRGRQRFRVQDAYHLGGIGRVLAGHGLAGGGLHRVEPHAARKRPTVAR